MHLGSWARVFCEPSLLRPLHIGDPRFLFGAHRFLRRAQGATFACHDHKPPLNFVLPVVVVGDAPFQLLDLLLDHSGHYLGYQALKTSSASLYFSALSYSSKKLLGVSTVNAHATG